MRNLRYITILGLAMLWLAGCATPSPKELPQDNVYTLSPEISCPQAAKRLPDTLKVDRPRTLDSLHGTGMYYCTTDLGKNRYQLNRWCDTPAQMLQQSMVRCLEKSGLFAHVVGSPLGHHARYRLKSELDAFHQSFEEGRSFAILSVKALLVDTGDGKIVATKRFDYRIPAPTDDAKVGVRAMQEAVGIYLRDLREWLIRTLEKEERQ
jgi:cholesterol transport system auxiliary component